MSVLRRNISLLFIIQLSNYVFPLLTIPYLSRVLGAENFGFLAISQAVIQYFIFFTEYGFNLSVTRKISLNRHDKSRVSEIFFSTMYAKIFLFILSIMMLFAFIFYFKDKSILYKELLLISFLAVLGNVIFPIWLFQGLESMGKITLASSLSKFICLCFTYILVRSSGDVLYAAGVQASGTVIAGIISIYIIYKRKYVHFCAPDIKSIVCEYKDGFALFISSIAISFYTTFNTILLGLYAPALIVGNYAAADKLRMAVQGLFSPVQQAVFPKVAQEIESSKNIHMVLKKYGIPFIIFGLFISLSIFLFGEFAAEIFFGSKYSLAPMYFKWMSIFPVVITIAIVVGTWGMVGSGNTKVLSKIYIFGAIIHMGYSFFLVKYFSVKGLIISVFVTEVIITTIMFVILLGNKNIVSNKEQL